MTWSFATQTAGRAVALHAKAKAAFIAKSATGTETTAVTNVTERARLIALPATAMEKKNATTAAETETMSALHATGQER